jgi:acylglycerol lipase
MTKTFTSTQHSWSAPGGETFSYSRWEPADAPPRALVVAVHGLSGAALDYEPLGSHLAGHGVTTLALELRGQGNDPQPGRRGDLAQIEDWFADLRGFFALARRLHPGLPIYYYGESMGSALLIRFLAQAESQDQPAGLVLASPVVAIARAPVWWQRWIFRFFLWIRPTHRIDVRRLARGQKNEAKHWVTRDEAHRHWFETAPHKLDRYTIRFFKCLLELIGGCQEAAPRLQVPILVLYAAHDVFIPPAEVETFFGRLGSGDKQLRFFPTSYHLLLHDFDKNEALEAVEAWLLPRLSALP